MRSRRRGSHILINVHDHRHRGRRRIMRSSAEGGVTSRCRLLHQDTPDFPDDVLNAKNGSQTSQRSDFDADFLVVDELTDFTHDFGQKTLGKFVVRNVDDERRDAFQNLRQGDVIRLGHQR